MIGTSRTHERWETAPLSKRQRDSTAACGIVQFRSDRVAGAHPGIVLSDGARRFFLERYEERLAVRVRHPAWEQNLTYRQCMERQAEHLARCILERDDAYRPLMLR